MLIGYARTSTVEQTAGFEAQIRDLKAAGCEKIFKEQVSGARADRVELERALEFAREGDTLVVTKLDRAARSTQNLLAMVSLLRGKKVGFKVLNLGIDTGTSTGKLIMTMLAGIAEFERDMMLERQREGIAKAKAEGKYTGAIPTARRKADKVLALQKDGVRPIDIARQLKMSRASVYRIFADAIAGKEAA